MIFSGMTTDEDIEKLKKRILKDPVYAPRILSIRAGMLYPNDGVRHKEHATAQMPTKAELLVLYKELIAEGLEVEERATMLALRKLRTKSNSGVAVVSLLTKPFACPGRCTYCPTEENMPKSYLAKEPAAARALANDFDPYLQITNRLRALEMNGHPVDKIEMIVIGGTWSFYHPIYQEEFLIGCYRACNDYGTTSDSRDESYTDRLDYLLMLQDRNERAGSRIIGLSIETRPDYITDFEITRLRKLGVTKVEIGVQHLDDAVLKLTKRDMTIDRVVRATELLRNAGFKMVYHMMPNLPGSTPERDISMFDELFSGENFQPDMLKIYPCMVLEHSTLFDEWKNGGFTVYTDEELIRVMREEKKRVPPYVRILRVYRDIPASYIKAGSTISNLRQVMDEDMQKNGWQCKCIRCREIREGEIDHDDFLLTETRYRTNSGTEIFLSFEGKKTGRIAAFARLRLPDDGGENAPLSILRGAALIRELHTYGRHTRVGEGGEQSQHVGFGRRLIAEAERIATENSYRSLAIISGIGVREYYRKRGYTLEETYMIKSLS
jgi:elongator complex protein 3